MRRSGKHRQRKRRRVTKACLKNRFVSGHGFSAVPPHHNYEKGAPEAQLPQRLKPAFPLLTRRGRLRPRATEVTKYRFSIPESALRPKYFRAAENCLESQGIKSHWTGRVWRVLPVGTGRCLSHIRVAAQPLGFNSLALRGHSNNVLALDIVPARVIIDIDRHRSVLA
jgi:hypothetical protein